MSVMNLNMYFNSIFNGVVAGQLSYSNSIPQIAKTFFPLQDESFPFGDTLGHRYSHRPVCPPATCKRNSASDWRRRWRSAHWFHDNH